MNWQPISTAPKDGAEIIVVVDGNVGAAMWCIIAHGFLWSWDHGYGYGDTISPTHWMPLPEPPTNNESPPPE